MREQQSTKAPTSSNVKLYSGAHARITLIVASVTLTYTQNGDGDKETEAETETNF